MTPFHVYDPDQLYRSVRPGEYTTREGKVTFSASAFNDRDHKPSVDTSAFRKDPRDARKSQADGVAKLIAGEVRKSCKIPIFDNKKRRTGEHSVDVLHRPIINIPGEPDNVAHCQVECHPTIDSDSRFKRLKEALAALANKYGLIVEPGSA
jgi:hypothetical protein